MQTHYHKIIEPFILMSSLFRDTKYFLLRFLSIFFLSLMLFCTSINAQHVEPLPDSVKAVADTVDSSASATTYATESNSVATDSAKNDVVQPEPAVFRKVPDTTVSRFKRDKDFAYANDPAYWQKDKVEADDSGGWFWRLISSQGAKIFIYVLMAAVLIFALYKIVVDNKLYLFYSKPKKISKISLTQEEDLSIENIDDKIREALSIKNHRLAVRYMFLKALKLLDEKELIRFHAQATNHEYALQLASTKFSKNFQYLTRVFEYVWYGEFAITQEQSELIQQNFNQFYTEIKS